MTDYGSFKRLALKLFIIQKEGHGGSFGEAWYGNQPLSPWQLDAGRYGKWATAPTSRLAPVYANKVVLDQRRAYPYKIHIRYMRYQITRYIESDEVDVLNALKNDRNWDILTNHETIDTYKKALKNGVTYVARRSSDFCGFIRALSDEGIALYISELFVEGDRRNLGIGQALIERMKQDFKPIKIYALSDEDTFYFKKGYNRIGSVFEI